MSVVGTEIVLLGFDSASDSHESPGSSFRPPFVIPAKAGIQRGGEGTVALRLVLSLAAGSFTHPARPTPRNFHTLVCRLQPA